MASLDDILSTQKNGVVAINSLNSYLATIAANTTILATAAFNTVPTTSSPTIVATTSLVFAGKGLLFSISIPSSSGSNQVFLHDSATVGGISSSNLIYASLPANAANFVPYRDIQIHVTDGLVVVAQTNMSAVVSYTPNI